MRAPKLRPDPGGPPSRRSGGVSRACSTAYHALLQRTPYGGDRVLIHGAARRHRIPAIQLAKLFGAEVIATASTEEKAVGSAAPRAADHAIDSTGGFPATRSWR